MRKKFKKLDYIKNCKILNLEYDYSLLPDNIGTDDYIKFSKNGLTYIQLADHHLLGHNPTKLEKESLLQKLQEIHSNRFQYNINIDKVPITSKIELKDNVTGDIFYYRVDRHLNGMKPNKITLNYFLFKSKEIHGKFLQNIHKHLKGQGCPDCKLNSKGEEYIKNHLEDIKVKYIRQYGFETCRYINKLSFDFYLPELNTCIEFDGIQHFKPINDFGGKKEFKIIQERDKCKNKWCIENNINLIRIKYDQIDKIKEILENQLQKLV